MNIKDITEDVSPQIKDQQRLNQTQYRKLIKRMKSSGTGGDKLAKHGLRSLMKMWKQGDRLTSNYKKIFDDCQVLTDDIF